MVFFCFSSKDRQAIVESILYHLDNYCIPVWYDRRTMLMSDQRNYKNFVEGVGSCRYAIIILSPNCVASKCANEEIELIPNGKEVKVTVENLAKFIDLSKKAKINESSHQMELIKKGFNEVLDLKICQILTWRQLEEYVCGKHKLDVNFLKENTEYREYNEKDPLIQWFWEWLNEIDDDMKIMYLKFVWGKTRLPKKENLGTQHKIDILSGGDGVFPHAATCFFKIKIPRYSSKKVLVDKLTYSIMNCTEIDGD